MSQPAGGHGARRFTSVREAAAAGVALARVAVPLVRAYAGGLAAPLRENVMLAVSGANACSRCVQVHQRWALRATGAVDTQRDTAVSDTRDGEELAVQYAVERTRAAFAPGSGAVAAQLRSHFSPQQVAQLDAIVRLITFANLSMNSMSALRRSLSNRAG